MNHLEIAEAFFRAMTEEDDQAVRDLCAPDVRPQQNGGPPLDVDALLGFAKLVHRAAKGFEYGDPVRSATATGFVQEHSIRGTLSDGQKVEVPTCVVGDISDGKITGLREYFDTAAGANLRAALNQSRTWNGAIR